MSFKNSLNKYLKRFNVEIHGAGYLQSLAKGDFKKNEFDFFKKVFQNKKLIIFDVGANHGNTIIEYINNFPASEIYAFEPYPPLVEMLSQKYKANDQVKIYGYGISDNEGSAAFYVNTSIDTNSFYASNKTGLNSDSQVKNVDQIEVPVITLDSFCRKEGIERINILKLDIQGSELKALMGAKELLQKKSVDVIYAETFFVEQYIDQPFFSTIVSFLYELDYVIQDIYNPFYGKGKLAWCDTVFVRKDLVL